MPASFHDLLKVDKSILRPFISGKKRKERVLESINWLSGSENQILYQSIWAGENGYEVKLGKPGKEASVDYNRCKYKDGHYGNNPNDMKPMIFLNGSLLENTVASFTDIFDELHKLNNISEVASELMACLLFRSAYMVDHEEVSEGVWRYDPPNEIVEKISEYISNIDGMPVIVFLNFLDVLAWNEDTKYHTLGYDITKDTGRRNNLLTCVNVIGVLLNKVKLSKFAGSFSRPPSGISAISRKEAFSCFPLLDD